MKQNLEYYNTEPLTPNIIHQNLYLSTLDFISFIKKQKQKQNKNGVRRLPPVRWGSLPPLIRKTESTLTSGSFCAACSGATEGKPPPPHPLAHPARRKCCALDNTDLLSGFLISVVPRLHCTLDASAGFFFKPVSRPRPQMIKSEPLGMGSRHRNSLKRSQ